MQISSQDADPKSLQSRYKMLYIAVGFFIFVIITRLWFLQIMHGNELRTFSEQNLLKEIRIPAPRGIIYDREGKILVENLTGFEATISPQYTEDLEATSKAVAKVLDMAWKKVVKKVKKSRRKDGPFRPVIIKDNLTRDEVFKLALLKLDHPGLDIKENILRTYPLGSNGAQFFGYVGEISKKQIPVYNEKFANQHVFKQGDIIGRSGLEETLDLHLRGHDGLSFVKVDAKGREAASESTKLLGPISRPQRAIPGANLTLTIDRDLQQAAYNAFQESEKTKTGALVMLKTNGEVLAWISTPSFDPNEFSRGISAKLWSTLVNDPDKPLRNKVLQDHNPPGSTFKPFVALAALQDGIITKDTLVNAPWRIKFGSRYYHDHTRSGQGQVRLREAIERSSNVFFYRQGIALGVDKMYNYISQLGIGEKTGIDLINEIPGLLPNSKWKKENIGEEWQPGENLTVAIGQSYVLTTPLQMAAAYAAIGTKGKLFKPFIVKSLKAPDGRIIKENKPKLVRDISDPKNEHHIEKRHFEAVKEGLWHVANGDRGTAKWWKIPGVEFAGKTGTAQVRGFSSDQIYDKCEERPREQRHHGWFIAYAPAENPEIAVAVLAEHACHGSTGGAPIARDAIWAYMEKYKPEMLKPHKWLKGPLQRMREAKEKDKDPKKLKKAQKKKKPLNQASNQISSPPPPPKPAPKPNTESGSSTETQNQDTTATQPAG